MRLLVAAPRFPWPLDKGDRLTVFNLLQHFGRRHAVALVCFLEPGQDPAWVGRLEGVVERVEVVPLRRPAAYGRAALGLASRRPLQVHYYRSRAMARRIRRVSEEFRPDLVYAHTIRMAEYLAGDRPGPGILAMQVSMAPLNLPSISRSPFSYFFIMPSTSGECSFSSTRDLLALI